MEFAKGRSARFSSLQCYPPSFNLVILGRSTTLHDHLMELFKSVLFWLPYRGQGLVMESLKFLGSQRNVEQFNNPKRKPNIGPTRQQFVLKRPVTDFKQWRTNCLKTFMMKKISGPKDETHLIMQLSFLCTRTTSYDEAPGLKASAKESC